MHPRSKSLPDLILREAHMSITRPLFALIVLVLSACDTSDETKTRPKHEDATLAAIQQHYERAWADSLYPGGVPNRHCARGVVGPDPAFDYSLRQYLPSTDTEYALIVNAPDETWCIGSELQAVMNAD